MPYLTQRALAGLKAYVYKPTGYTVLDDLHEPLFRRSVQLLPLWLAPNLITLVGTMGLVGAYLLNAYYLPDFIGEAPRWLPLVSAASVVIYTWLDCLDGKQARRTGSSSPLGQLFDHGCDALSVNLLLANIGCSLWIGCGWAHALGNLGVCFTWILAQWEEYHTGVMSYGNSYYGVLEANYTLAGVHILTVAIGRETWLRSINSIMPTGVLLPFVGNWKLNEAIIMAMITMGSYQGMCNIYRVFNYNYDNLPAKERGHKQLDRTSATLHFVLLMIQLVLGCMINWPTTCTAMYCCRGSSLLFGVVYALVASQLIMAHMCKEPFSVPLWTVAVLALPALNATLGLVDQALLIYFLNALALSAYLHWVVTVIGQICDYLNINCLTIKKKEVE